MSNISDYDMFSYDYSQYWQKRRYEHLAEKSLLDRMLDEKEGDWFLDVGGSYGRLTPTYFQKYNHPVILDYSAKTLRNNYEILKNKYPNIELIAANAYKMPFRDDVFDGGMMIRVLHHIEKPSTYFKEIRRVMQNNSCYIQEYANKMHIKAIIRALLKKNFDFFTKEPYKQPSISMSEGTKQNVEGIFLNYHPKHITELLEKNHFQIQKKYGCSFFRAPFFKKILNDDTLLFMEKIMRATISFANFSPSIFVKTEVHKKSQEKKSKKKQVFDNIKDILVCPECKGNLEFSEHIATCIKCKKEYTKKDNVWDFRAV